MFDSLKNVLATLVDIVQVRLQLFGTEVQEELARFLGRLWLTAVALLLGTLAMAFTGVAVIVASGEQHRALACALVAAAFMLATVIAFVRLRQAFTCAAPLFAASLAELTQDSEDLRTRREKTQANR